jgi:hypothetical protein
VTAAVVLDWRDRSHWSPRVGKCRVCKNGQTHLRDDRGRPCHKVCAEAEIATPAGRS